MSSQTIDVNTTIRQVFVRILPRHILDNITFVIFAFKMCLWTIYFGFLWSSLSFSCVRAWQQKTMGRKKSCDENKKQKKQRRRQQRRTKRSELLYFTPNNSIHQNQKWNDCAKKEGKRK